ncbi:M15 family metallopeptidase [Deinococcus irradiatisoli]|nr:M15 family metallopeptidase [Deinococcus irradiatisoli]
MKAENPALYAATGTAGMLCVRCIRGYPKVPSNHAFGAAIDLKMNGQLVPLNAPWAQKGTLDLYHYFHAEGWYWGADWDRPDSMHFEVSDEKMRIWGALGMI